MIVFQTLIFVIAAVFYLLNLNNLVVLIFKNQKSKNLHILLAIPYFVSCILMSVYSNGSSPFIYFCATVCFYISIYIYIAIKKVCKKITSAYIVILFLSIDSIIQSLGCIIIRMFDKQFNQFLVWKISSLLFNIIAFIVLRYLIDNYKNQVRDSVKLLSSRIYILLLISLFIIGELCGNMAQAEKLSFTNNVNSLFTTLTVLIFLVVIMSFVFSSISKQYYESISKVMEKQVHEQVNYYQKINKLSDDIREFRHDYKNHMICLQALLEGKEYADALEYVRDITRQDIIESNKFFSGNQIADAILSDKAELAKQSGCKIEFDGFISDEIRATDLCIILSNALDNAIEACARFVTDDTKIITLKCDVKQGIQLIRISNPNEKNVSATETSKEDKDNHGFGLYNIRHTVENHNGHMSITSKTPVFILDLEFPVT